MAITPEDAAKLTDTDIAFVTEAEAAIDKKLREEYVGEHNQKIAVYFNGGMSLRASLEINARYRAAGWDIQYEHNPGKGCRFTLQKRVQQTTDLDRYARRPDFS